MNRHPFSSKTLRIVLTTTLFGLVSVSLPGCIGSGSSSDNDHYLQQQEWQRNSTIDNANFSGQPSQTANTNNDVKS